MGLAARGDGNRVCASAQGRKIQSSLAREKSRASGWTYELQARKKLKIVKCDTLSRLPTPRTLKSIRRGKNSW